MKKWYTTFLEQLAIKGVKPNKVTWFRLELWLALLVFWLLVLHRFHKPEYLLVLIILSVPIWLLDKVDSDLARHTNQVTDDGAMLDPFVDKIKIYLGFAIISIDLFYPRLVALFLISFILDATSTYLRGYQSSHKKGALYWGKYKLFFQVIAMICFALAIYLGICFGDLYEVFFVLFGGVLLIISIIFSIISLHLKIKTLKKEGVI